MVKRLLFLPVVLIVLLACSFIPSNTSPPVVGEPQIPSSQIPRASLSEAKSAFDRSTAVFVDVRALSSYQAGHIPGALSIPVDEIEGRLGELDPAQWIITYCTWPNEESSARAAQILQSHGFSNVTPLLGGFHAWEDAAYPVEAE